MNAQQIQIAQEPVPPPTPPGSGGRIALQGRAENDIITIEGFARLSDLQRWIDVSASERRVILVPVAGTGSFLAFGLTHSSTQPDGVYSSPFVAMGSMGNQLWQLMVQMQRDGAQVEFFAEAPVEGLQQYLSKYDQRLRQSETLAALLNSFLEETLHEQNFKRPAA
jgi:hypothetical protein